MKDMIKRMTALLLLVALLVTVLPLRADAADSTDTALTKLTDEYNPGTGSFTLSEQSRIFLVSDAATGAPADWKQTAELISSEFNTQFKSTGFPLPLVYGSANRVRTGDIILVVGSDSASTLAAEGYTLSITTDNCTVTAKDVDGLLYGAFMLLRHFSVYGGTTIPACTVKDEPDTKERTLMLDCARKYWSVEWIENLIRQMAWMGYNTLELHMTEDQGMHMNIWSEEPDCNGNDFSWLCGYEAASWAAAYSDKNGGNNYSAAQITEIVNLAHEYHIDVIPSMDVPGHCDYMNNKYTAKVASDSSFTFNYAEKTYTSSGIRDSNGVITPYDTTAYPNAKFTSINNNSTKKTVDVTNPVARAFSLAVLQGYAVFFANLGCKKFNFGCDEVVLDVGGVNDGWATYAKAHVTNGSNNYDTLYDYNNEVNQMLLAAGYQGVRAFNEVLFNNTASVSLDSNIEICYWEDPKAAFGSVSSYVNNNRTLFNCNVNYCYYVLRYSTATDGSGGDARDPSTTNWGFHHSTESSIYNGWNPTRMYPYTASSPTVNGESLGGGYFLIWGDWAGWNSEVQVWNGLAGDDDRSKMDDTGPSATAAGNEGGTYNLIDRMWSNSVKMWNWDIDSSLSYNSYWPLRNKYRLYPGFIGPTTAPSMESGSTLTEAPDFPALKNALDRKPALSQSEYSADSYSAWQAAWNSAKLVYDNHLSTSAEVQKATTDLNTAFNGLETPPATITLVTTIGGKEKTIETIEVNSGTVARVICTPPGYCFSYVEGSVTACKLFSGASAIILTGTVTPATPAKVYYKNTPDLSLLKRLLDAAANAPEGSAYASAVAAAQEFYNSCSTDPAASVTQAEIDKKVTALLVARTQASFADASVTTEIISVRSTSDYVAKGKSAVLIVTTSADVTKLEITDPQVTLAEYVAQESTMANGDVVKVWYLRFPMDSDGTYSYTLTATGNRTDTASVQLICK